MAISISGKVRDGRHTLMRVCLHQNVVGVKPQRCSDVRIQNYLGAGHAVTEVVAAPGSMMHDLQVNGGEWALRAPHDGLP